MHGQKEKPHSSPPSSAQRYTLADCKFVCDTTTPQRDGYMHFTNVDSLIFIPALRSRCRHYIFVL